MSGGPIINERTQRLFGRTIRLQTFLYSILVDSAIAQARSIRTTSGGRDKFEDAIRLGIFSAVCSEGCRKVTYHACGQRRCRIIRLGADSA